jgi:hypothetical protein
MLLRCETLESPMSQLGPIASIPRCPRYVRLCSKSGDKAVMETLHIRTSRVIAAIRRAAVTEHYSALILTARITLRHFPVSWAISLPKSAGESTSTSPPRSASRALILGSARPPLISLLSLSTMSAGVFFGSPMPVQKLNS